jgi:glyoxylase-like metal-dependent hydrolase (beta-lactamase superfamily II)
MHVKAEQLAPNLQVLDGAVNTGVLVSGSKALLIDCCDTVTPDRLAALGVESVTMILCTQHRRANVAGACRFAQSGAALVVPEAERHLFEDVDAYWADWKNRWHIYHHQPGAQVLTRPLPVTKAVKEGDVIEWEGHAIRVLDTPGATDGSVSYLVTVEGATFAFTGDALYGPGQVWDLHSLQKGNESIRDYHGFMGNRAKLEPTLAKLGACGAKALVPSHGAVIRNPEEATTLTLARLDMLWHNYTAISCLNHYFPALFDDTKHDPARMKPAEMRDPPAWVRRVDFTSYAVVSETGAALLTDCGHDSVVGTLHKWLRDETITSVEGCWVTHYHDDHVDALGRLAVAFDCPIMCDEHMAEVVEYPSRFFLPCISPNPAPVARATRDGESWQWREFKLTAFHFPGQTYYHGGLLVEGHGERVFFAGDSGAPTGIDDHCCPNRNFLGEGKGFRRCFEVWRQHKPDYIFNQHQSKAFRFTDAELDYMHEMLAKREQIIADMVPWPHPNFALDEYWCRAYPFEQDASPATTVAIDVQFTNHGSEPADAAVEPVLPEGWRWDKTRGVGEVALPPNTDGSTDPYCANPDKAARVWVNVAADATPGRYVIPFRVTFNGRYLGQYRHAIVVVR